MCALLLELFSAAGSALDDERNEGAEAVAGAAFDTRIVSTIERPSTQTSAMSSNGTRSTKNALHSLAGSGSSNAASANDACVCENGRRENSAAAGSVPMLRIEDADADVRVEADDALGVC